ncbi:MAG TPA: hypothetical protein PKI19_03795 [Elusimicrobiales bacterium]|nr:hypothetical protein [Elusimicrobiales bacterium]
MADNSNGRKKTFIVSILAFLLIGGGVFLFFIIQGSNDLTKSKNGNFQYGSIARSSLAPFFKALGLVEEKPGRNIHQIRLDKFLEKQAAGLDMDSWMANNNPAAADAAPRNSASARAPSGPPSVVPRMAGGGGGGIAGGGSSNSSGARSGFEAGSAREHAKVTAGSASGSAVSGKEGGVLGSLRGAQAMLNTGLRSGSAMTAKTSWDKSFGVGTTGGGSRNKASGGNMAYSGGLVGLDTIKSGELKNLKTSDISGKSAPAANVPKPVDEEGKDKEKSLTDGLGAELTKGMTEKASSLFNGKGGGGGEETPSANIKYEEPPADIKRAAEAPWDPNSQDTGYYCKTPCQLESEGGYEFVARDSQIDYHKEGEEWVATYRGEYATGNTEKSQHYADYTQSYTVGADGKLTPRGEGTCKMPDGSTCPAL